MSIDHVAITTKDLAATHRFYTEAIGFTLVRVEVLDTPTGGWMRHAFYDTGDGTTLAVFDFHDDTMGPFTTALSSGLGLPVWANHLAFGAGDLDALEQRRLRLLDHGVGCVVMDHDSAIALYVDDPNGIMIEFSSMLRPLRRRPRTPPRRSSTLPAHRSAPPCPRSSCSIPPGPASPPRRSWTPPGDGSPGNRRGCAEARRPPTPAGYDAGAPRPSSASATASGRLTMQSWPAWTSARHAPGSRAAKPSQRAGGKVRSSVATT